MHEVGIASSLLDAVRAEAQRFPGAHIFKVGVRIGEFAGVDPDAVSFCFEALVRGSELEPLELDIEYCRRGEERSRPDYLCESPQGAACLECETVGARIFGGDELELSYLEVDDEPRAAGA